MQMMSHSSGSTVQLLSMLDQRMSADRYGFPAGTCVAVLYTICTRSLQCSCMWVIDGL